MELRVGKAVRDNDKVRCSFFGLAKATFGIDLESWHREGFWKDRYIPYAWVDGEEVAANVSVNTLDWVLHGEIRRAIQIGTVMTRPEYRLMGLSASLFRRVLEEYEGRYDVMYLFANESVQEFYPRFGFHAAAEHVFGWNIENIKPEPAKLRKMDIGAADDLRLIYRLACNRVPVSRRFGTVHAEDLLMFYCLNAFPNDIYLLEEEETLVVFKKEEGQMDLYDVIGAYDVNLHSVIRKLAGPDMQRVVFHFTPDDPDIVPLLISHPVSSGLFIRSPDGSVSTQGMKHPATSIA